MIDFVAGARASEIRPLVALPRGGAAGTGSPLALPAPWPTLPTSTLAVVDFRGFVPRIENQTRRDACVGFGFENGRRVAVRGKGRPGSPIGIYVGARVRESKRKGAPVLDHGCMPADAADHLVSVGVEPWDARDDDESKVNDFDTWVESASAQKLSMDDLVPLVDGDVDTLDRWFTWAKQNDRPLGATFVMDVDPSYQALGPGSPIYAGPFGPSLGNHDQCCVGYESLSNVGPCYIVQGSWGIGFGDGGYTYIPRETFRKIATEIILVKGGPTL